MPVDVMVERRWISVEPHDGEPFEVPVGGQSKLPHFLAMLQSADHPWVGVSAQLVWRSATFGHLSEQDFQRVVRKYRDVFADALGEWSQYMRIELGGSGAGRTLRVAVSDGATLATALDAMSLVENDEATDEHSPWLSLPQHDLRQLRLLTLAISDAAKRLDVGSIKASRNAVEAALAQVSAPLYVSVLRFRLARACLRQGHEEAAKKEVAAAMKIIDTLTPADPILTARARYNRAWIAYTEGYLGFKHIQRAQQALREAGPDDIRHGYIATQHGLIVLKSLERTNERLSNTKVHEKVREALTYLSHAVYLLTRSEDFWGAQESCWNLAYGFFTLSQIPSNIVHQAIGSDEDALSVADAWIAASDDIAKKHATGRDSVRNFVLKAQVAMARRQLSSARTLLGQATEQIKPDASPREKGRAKAVWVDYYLLLCETDDQASEKHRGNALRAYREAERILMAAGLEKLVKNELERKYTVKDGSITRRTRRRTA